MATETMKYTDEELLDDIRRVGDIVDGNPSTADYHEHGVSTVNTHLRRFGSWLKAKELAGFDGRSPKVSDEDYIDDIRRVVDMLEQVPTKTQYDALGKHSSAGVMHRFGSWTKAVNMAGFEPRKGGKDRPPAEQLYEMYYDELMTAPEMSKQLGVSQDTLLKWMNEAGIEKLPKGFRFLMSNGPSVADESPVNLELSGIHRFKLRRPMRSTGPKKTTNNITTVYYLPIHEPEEIVRAVLDDAADVLREYQQRSVTYLFTSHGRPFADAFEELRSEYDL